MTTGIRGQLGRRTLGTWLYRKKGRGTTVGDMGRVEALFDEVGGAPFCRDHHILPWLIPEVVVEGDAWVVHRPDPLRLIGFAVQEDKVASHLVVVVSEGRDHDIPVSETMRRVGKRYIEFCQLRWLNRL